MSRSMEHDNAQFSIVYDGEGVADGSIDTRDLAPALLALSELVEEARGQVPGAPPELSLRVRAGFERGSFEVTLELARLYQQVVSMFSGQDASAWSNLLQIIGISGGFGLFQLIRRARSRKPTSVTVEHTESVKITFEGDSPFKVDKHVWALFNNMRARKAVESVVRPLRSVGIDEFKIRHRGQDTVDVPENEAEYYAAPTEHEGEVITVNDTRVMIVAPSFQPGNKWRVSDGSRTIFVSINDPNFTHAVQAGVEAFRKGDILEVQLQTRQWMEGGELKAEHSIIRVLAHDNAPTQKKLPFPSRSDEQVD